MGRGVGGLISCIPNQGVVLNISPEAEGPDVEAFGDLEDASRRRVQSYVLGDL